MIYFEEYQLVVLSATTWLFFAMALTINQWVREQVIANDRVAR